LKGVAVGPAPDELYALALAADGHLLGPDQAAWLDRLDEQRDALDSLLDHLTDAGDAERALTLAGALARFWWMRGHKAAGRGRVGRALALPGGSDAARTAALVGAGGLAYAAGDFPAARHFYEQVIPLIEATGRELDLARALDRAGMAARQLTDLAAADALHARALEIQRRLGTPAEQALCLNNLGVVAFFRGDAGAAGAYHREALALRARSGDARGTASSLNNLGQIALAAGDPAAARDLMERGLGLRRGLGDRWGVAGSQVNLAAAYSRLGDSAAARDHLREAGAGFRAVGDPLGLCECLEAAAELARAEGRPADAVRALSGATHRRGQLPAPRPPVLERDVTECLAELRAALGEEAFEAAWRDGREAGDALLDGLV
jgi:tetratricopeptide (TPR) repeat protein